MKRTIPRILLVLAAQHLSHHVLGVAEPGQLGVEPHATLVAQCARLDRVVRGLPITLKPPSRTAGRASDVGDSDTLELSVAEAIHQRLLLAAIDLDHRAVDEMGQIRSEVGDEAGRPPRIRQCAPAECCAGRAYQPPRAGSSMLAGHRVNEAGPSARYGHGPGLTATKLILSLAVLRSERKCQVLPGSVRRSLARSPSRRVSRPSLPIRLTTQPAPPAFRMIGNTCFRQRT